jgi:hypothetical protein
LKLEVGARLFIRLDTYTCATRLQTYSISNRILTHFLGKIRRGFREEYELRKILVAFSFDAVERGKR